MKKLFTILCIAFAIIACSKEQTGDVFTGSTLTICAGYEGDPDPEVKTYIKDASAGTIWWGNTTQDRTLFVFDESDVKNTFTSESTTAEAVRAFTSDTWPGGNWKYAVWTGNSEAKDQCVLNGNILSGPTLKVLNPQSINNSKSFCNTGNIAVMKPTDGVLKNVFGYLRFTLPAYPGGSLSAVRYVTLTADENVAGEVKIDCSASDPVATIISNGNASKSLTLNARYKQQGPQGYEGGVVWMILPAGTYHNASLTITPFTSDPTEKEAALGEPFTVKFTGNLVIKRGKYTDCGTLPAKDSSSSEPSTPSISNWPNDAAAFDYGLAAGTSKIAAMPFSSAGITSGVSLTEPVTLDKITYCGNETRFYGNPRVVMNRAKAFTKVGGMDIPTTATQNMFFKINRPGELSFFPRYTNISNNPTFIVALVTVTASGTSTKYVFSGGPAAKSSSESDKDKDDYRITVPITKSDLQGITEAATVYVFHKDVGEVLSYYPLTWTVSSDN